MSNIDSGSPFIILVRIQSCSVGPNRALATNVSVFKFSTGIKINTLFLLKRTLIFSRLAGPVREEFQEAAVSGMKQTSKPRFF